MANHAEGPETRKFKCSRCGKAFKFKHHLKVSVNRRGCGVAIGIFILCKQIIASQYLCFNLFLARASQCFVQCTRQITLKMKKKVFCLVGVPCEKRKTFWISADLTATVGKRGLGFPLCILHISCQDRTQPFKYVFPLSSPSGAWTDSHWRETLWVQALRQEILSFWLLFVTHH